MKNIFDSKISILSPVYNEEKFIHESIESVIQQTYTDWELIIVDDGSTDRTVEIIKNCFKDDRIKLIQPGKVGKSAAFNLGYSHSVGGWIVFFGGDDGMKRDSLEKRLRPYFRRKPREEKLAVAGKIKTFSSNRKFDGILIPKDKKKGAQTGGSIMLSRSLCKTIFPIPENLVSEDTWTMLCVKYFTQEVTSVADIVLDYRLHKNNSMNRNLGFEQMSEELHKRNFANELFLKEKNSLLSVNEKAKVKQLIDCETARFKGDKFRILTSKLGLKQRIRNLVLSDEKLYKIRKKYFSLFSGL